MAWAVLFLAGLFEIVWAYTMKLSDGFSKPLPTVITIIFVIASFLMLSYAMRTLPLGTAYTIWSGIGVVGSFIAGIVILGEQASLMRILAALMICIGLILMKL